MLSRQLAYSYVFRECCTQVQTTLICINVAMYHIQLSISGPDNQFWRLPRELVLQTRYDYRKPYISAFNLLQLIITIFLVSIIFLHEENNQNLCCHSSFNICSFCRIRCSHSCVIGRLNLILSNLI